MMKKAVFALALVLVLGSVSAALAEVKVEGDAYVGVFDKYVWRGFDLSGSTPVVQGGVDLSAHNLTLGYWTNVQTKTDEGYEGGDANETDITLDYALDLGEKVSLHVGNIYYTLDGVDDNGHTINDTNELYLSATLNTILEPTLKGYYDWDEFKDDRFYTLSIGHSVELGMVTVSAGALASYADNAYANVPWNAELSLKADVALTDQITVTPSFLYSSPLSNDAQEEIDTELVAGLNIAHSF